MEELTKAQIAIVKEIEKLIVELRGGPEEQIWKKSFEKILKLVDEFARQFNNEVQHLGEQKRRCYPKCLCQRTTNILPWTKENS